MEKLYSHNCLPAGQTVDGAFSCDMCPRKFSEARYLESHQQEAHGPDADTEQICVVCKLACPTLEDLVEHVQTHGKPKAPETAQLVSQTNEPQSVVTFECSDCGKFCNTKAQLMIHQRIHTGERPFVCPHCAKTFRYRQNLKEHLNSHQGMQL